ncbi:MAG TPA: peroxiredoxin, partial [Trinickia sp.]|nr:peroxiredoxin [Trinickia sp.]
SRHIIDAYDAAMPLMKTVADRVSYVIAPDGTILYQYSSLSPDKHVQNTLQAVKAWWEKTHASK